MISEPVILLAHAQAAAVIHVTTPPHEMIRVLGPAARELIEALAAQGIEPIGGLFVHHLRLMPKTFDVEVGVKVARAVKAKGRVKPGQLPSAKVARTIYQGPYQGLPAAWQEFDRWIKLNDYQQADDLWELYSVGPETTSDPANYLTELTWRIVA